MTDVQKLVAAYVALLAGCIVFSYVLDVRPRVARDWRYLTATITFLTWLLIGFAFVRSP